MQARNQSYLRRKNKEDIIRLLREQSRSYSDIARVLQLSNTAVAKIADDLMEEGLITRQSDTKGRKGITLKINADYGYVIAVDLSGRTLNVCAADFESNVLLSRSISEVVSFSRSDFDNVISVMREMTLHPALAERKLCCICLATLGKLSESGEFILRRSLSSCYFKAVKGKKSSLFGANGKCDYHGRGERGAFAFFHCNV